MNVSLNKSLAKRELLLGAWVQIGHPAVAEIFAQANFDWIGVDCEHTDIGVEGLTAILRATPAASVLARVKENSVMAIRLALDAGVVGVIVPLVSSRGEAEAAVAAAKYPPDGIRGFAFCRANAYGVDFNAQVAKANATTAVIVMIETRRAVENICEILAVPGVDGIFVGPYDLSGSFGIPGQVDSPTVREACAKVFAAAVAQNKSSGIHLVKPTQANLRDALACGCNFIALGMDTVFLAEKAQDMLGLKEQAMSASGAEKA